jgi:hypothetical protein
LNLPALILRVGPVATLWQRPDTTGPATLSVRWTTPQGASRTGEIPGRADAAPGSLTAVWINKAGQLTTGPLSRTDVWERVIEAVAVTAASHGSSGGWLGLVAKDLLWGQWPVPEQP